MDDAVVMGLIAMGVGLIVTLAGYGLFRVLLVIGGAVSGFSFGYGLASSWDLGGFWAIALGVVAAVLLAWLAFAFYQVAVYLGLGLLVFALGAGVMQTLGVSQTWAVVGVGVALAVVCVLIAIAADLVTILIVIATALSGAELVVTGLMVLTEQAPVVAVTTQAAYPMSAPWWIAMLALAAVGIAVQWRAVGRRASLAGSRAQATRASGAQASADLPPARSGGEG